MPEVETQFVGSRSYSSHAPNTITQVSSKQYTLSKIKQMFYMHLNLIYFNHMT
jgi:hypothetical protein